MLLGKLFLKKLVWDICSSEKKKNIKRKGKRGNTVSLVE